MTIAEAETSLESNLDAVVAVVGGTWERFDVSLERNCEVSPGVAGVRNGAYRTSAEAVVAQEKVDLVTAHWTELGYELTERADESDVSVLKVFATTPDGAELQFTASANAMTLDGLTACVPAD